MYRPFEIAITLVMCFLFLPAIAQQPSTKPELLPWHDNFNISRIELSADGQYLITLGDDKKTIITDLKKRLPLATIEGVADDFLVADQEAPFFYTLTPGNDSLFLQKRNIPSGTIVHTLPIPMELPNERLKLSKYDNSPIILADALGYNLCYEDEQNSGSWKLVTFSMQGIPVNVIPGINGGAVHAIKNINGKYWVLTAEALWTAKNGKFEKVFDPGKENQFANMQAKGDTLVILSGKVQWFDTKSLSAGESTDVRSFYAGNESEIRDALVLRARHPFAVDKDGAAWLVNSRRLELQPGKSKRPYYVARVRNGSITYPLTGPPDEMDNQYREVDPAFAYNSTAGIFAFIKSRSDGETEIVEKEKGHLFTLGRRHIPIEDIFMLSDTGRILVRLRNYFSDGVILDLSNGSMEAVSLRNDYHINTPRFAGSEAFKPSSSQLQLYSPGRKKFIPAGTWVKGMDIRINIPRKDSCHFILSNGVSGKLDEAGIFRWFSKENKKLAEITLTDDEQHPLEGQWIFDRFSFDSISKMVTLYWKSRTTFSSELVHIIDLVNRKLKRQNLARGFLLLPGGKEYVTGEGIFELEDNRNIVTFPAGYNYASRFTATHNGDFICFINENYSKEDEVLAWDRKQNKLYLLGTHQGIEKMIPDPNSHHLFTTGRDQKIKIWDLRKPGVVATIILNGNRKDYREIEEIQPSYLVMLPDGHYMGENKYYQMLAWREGEHHYPVHLMDARYHRPDKVLHALGYADHTLVETLAKMADRRAERTKPAETAGDIAFTGKPAIPYFSERNNVRLSYSLPDEAGAGMMIYVNGTSLWPSPQPITTLKKENRNFIDVSLVDENNHIRICLVDNKGKETAGDYFYVNAAAGTKKDLYFVGIGVSAYADSQYNLRYAEKDMQDTWKYFMTTTSFENTHSFRAVNEKVTKKVIDSIQHFLGKAKAGDQVVFYYAGHGMLDTASGNYYLSTHDWQTSKPSATGLLIDDINRVVASSPARKKIMLIDACNSGLPEEGSFTAFQEDSSTAVVARGFKVKPKAQSTSAVRFAFNHFNQGNGVDIMAAAAGNEFAYETDSLQNGLFTYSLLSALKSGDADRDNNNGIAVSEMQQYVSTMVKRMSRGRQQPSFRQANLYQDISLVASGDSYFAAMIQAAQEDHLPTLKICIEYEKVPVNKTDEHGFSALHYACRQGSLKAVKYLIEKNADINLKTTFHFTGLYLAAINRHDAVVYQLLEKGADPSAQLLPWQMDTVRKRATAFTMMMLTDRDKMKAQEHMQYQLIRFLANNELAAADSLYEKERPDVNYWHYGEGINACFVAIFRKKQQALEWLLLHGLDVNLTNAAIGGFTPLMAAAYADNADAAQSLLKHGANKNARDKNGYTALDVARENKSQGVLAILEK